MSRTRSDDTTLLNTDCACGCGSSHQIEGLFRRKASRRSILQSMALLPFGVGGLMDAAGAQVVGKPEASKLRLGYVPVTCAVPILAASAFGFFESEGLEVELARTPSWALVRDKLINGEYDASQLILPMPLAISMGVGSTPTPIRVAAIENTNGSAVVLHQKHRGRQDPRQWKGFKFGVPFEQSIHNLLLRYLLAESGLNPDTDVEIRVMPPADSVSSLQSGNLDGMLFAEPWGQRAVFEGAGFYYALSRDIFPGHACCAVSVTERFVAERPNTYGALVRSLVKAINFVAIPDNKPKVAEVLSGPGYFNQPKVVLEQVLLGRFADGLGQVKSVPDRIAFKAQPSVPGGIWMLTQMRRWGYIKTDIDYAALVSRVFAPEELRQQMRGMGVPTSDGDDPVNVLGKPFDSSDPEKYLASFAIARRS